ncbi:hypothetical protein SNEBB_007085 [Seison nebaliae]|nr:hypothetical protein SNEBB_007085 [Seison nebaliae]
MRSEESEERRCEHITLENLKDLMCRRGRNGTESFYADHGSIEEFLLKLRTSSTIGIEDDPNELRLRYHQFGRNVMPEAKSRSFLQLMWEAMKDLTLIILLVAALISFGLSFYHTEDHDATQTKYELIESLAIFLAVLIVVLVTAGNDYVKEKQFKSLKEKMKEEEKFSVVRHGETIRILTRDLLVGDICYLQYGDIVPADGILIENNNLKIDEASLTGESDLVNKSIKNDIIVLSGTAVMEGKGKIVITAVGENSQAGLIYRLMIDPKVSLDHLMEEPNNAKRFNKTLEDSLAKKSILQRKLAKLALRIGYFGLAAALLTATALIIHLAIHDYVIGKKSWSNNSYQSLVKITITGITVLVLAVPEGLPLAVTIALAYGVRKMLYDHNLVRHLHACETMGNATTICSDKTGTLTTNRMTVVQLFIYEEYFQKIPEKLPAKIRPLLSQCIAINSNYTTNLIKQAEGPAVQVGNKTECALLGLLVHFNFDYDNIRSLYPPSGHLHIYTFNSDRKYMGTIVNFNNQANFVLYMKGAPEIILAKSKYSLNEDAKRDALDGKKREKINNVLNKMTNDGLRTICLAYRMFTESESQVMDWEDESSVVDMLTCIGIVGIEDPVRDEVPKSIRLCNEAGITIRMVTGDNIDTARTIAKKCGILEGKDDELVLDGSEFINRITVENVISQTLFDQIWPNLRVLARAKPVDKYILVKHAIASRVGDKEEIVAVTGDGTNDGPALKVADVGFAMGIQGTDIAKDASDIIITNDNFASIVKAVLWGRNVYDCITKFLQFQLTANVTAVLLAFIGSCFLGESPLRAVQILWINLIMDTLASLALASESPTQELLERKPFGRSRRLLSPSVIKYILGHSFYQLIVTLIILFVGPTIFLVVDASNRKETFISTPTEHYTFIFHTFVLMTLFNELNARKIWGQRNIFIGLHKSYIFVIIWVCCFSLQHIIVYIGGRLVMVRNLPADLYIWSLLFGIGSLIWHQVLICWSVERFEEDIDEKDKLNRNKFFSDTTITTKELTGSKPNQGSSRASLISSNKGPMVVQPHLSSKGRQPPKGKVKSQLNTEQSSFASHRSGTATFGSQLFVTDNVERPRKKTEPKTKQTIQFSGNRKFSKQTITKRSNISNNSACSEDEEKCPNQFSHSVQWGRGLISGVMDIDEYLSPIKAQSTPIAPIAHMMNELKKKRKKISPVVLSSDVGGNASGEKMIQDLLEQLDDDSL